MLAAQASSASAWFSVQSPTCPGTTCFIRLKQLSQASKSCVIFSANPPGSPSQKPPPHKNLGSAAPHRSHVNPGHSFTHLGFCLRSCCSSAPAPFSNQLCPSHPTLPCRPDLFSPLPLRGLSHKPPALQMPFPLGPVSPHNALPCVLPKNCVQVASCTYLALSPRLQSPSRIKPGAPFE